jgi:hypothetical protein
MLMLLSQRSREQAAAVARMERQLLAYCSDSRQDRPPSLWLEWLVEMIMNQQRVLV